MERCKGQVHVETQILFIITPTLQIKLHEQTQACKSHKRHDPQG